MLKVLCALMIALSLLHDGEMTAREGTLVIVGATADTIVIAADSATSANGKLLGTSAKKIFKVGKYGACFLEGTVTLTSIRDGKIAIDADFPGVISHSLATHPLASIVSSYQLTLSALLEAIHLLQVKHPDMHGDPNHSFLSFGCVGYQESQAKILTTDFYSPLAAGQQTVTKATEHELRPGLFAPLGASATSNEIIRGAGGKPFVSAKEQPVVMKYKSALRAAGLLESITTEDLIDLAKICLEATETQEGRDFDTKAYTVGGPNHFAVIDRHQGFRWTQK